MNARMTLIILTLILLTAPPAALAETTVRASVDRTVVAPGESLMLRVTIQDDDGNVDLSAITDFKVLSRGSGTNVQIVNGKMTKTATYNYVLIPRRQGRLTIPPLAVALDGRRLFTQPITIQVSARPADQKAAADKEVWVTAEVSNASPVQGEQFTYTFRYFRAVQTDDARYQQPSFKGFTAKEIEDQRSYRRSINGREHVVTQLDYVLTALEAGTRTIEPAMLQVGIVRRDNRRTRSPFDGIFGRRTLDQRNLQSDAVEVKVRPLPHWQGSPAFSGLVGRFQWSADMEAADLKVGDSATLALTLKGRGNLMDARAPELQLPPSLKHYADNPEEKIQLDRQGYSGRKVFRTALVPVEAGEIRIDPIQLVYFDTQEGRYRTLTAMAPTLSVAPGDADAESTMAVTPNPLALAKQRVAFTGRDILPPKESLSAVRTRAPLSSWLFALTLAAPALVYAGLVMTQRFRHQEQTPAALMRARARQSLKRAADAPDSERLGHLYQALTAAILAAAGRTGEALTWKEAETTLKESGRSDEQAGEAAALLSKIESGKFGASTLDGQVLADLLDQTRKMIRRLAS